MSGRLAGRVALVTGATRGLGAAIARLYAAEGAHVVLVGRTQGGLEEQDDRIRAAGGSATLLHLDLNDLDRIDLIGPNLMARFGRLDILSVNAAMLGRVGPTGHLDAAESEAVVRVNLTANWRLIRTLDPLLRLAPAGRATVATCAVGREPTAYFSVYGAAKAGLEVLARSWQAELGLTRIKVAVIDPGPIATKLRRAAFPGEDPATIQSPDQAAGRFLEAVA